MNRLSVTEASTLKSCSGQAIRDAVKRGVIDAEVFGRTHIVKANRKFEDWQPQAVRQKAGKARAKKAKKAKRSK